MTIHHATIKKAASQGFSYEETEEGVWAIWTDRPEIRAFDSNPKTALELAIKMKMAVREYPGLGVEMDEEGNITFTQGDETLAEGTDYAETFAEALEAYSEGEEAVDEAEGDEEGKGSIVKGKYRAEYKARGTVTHCGDWFAEQANEYTSDMVSTERVIKGNKVRTTKPKADIEKMYALAIANGVTKQWRNLNPGQQAMNARNMVRAVVIKTGKLEVPGSLTGGTHLTLEAPAEYLALKRKAPAAKAE